MATNFSHFGIRKFFVGPSELSSKPVIKLIDHQLTLKWKLLQENNTKIQEKENQILQLNIEEKANQVKNAASDSNKFYYSIF